MGLRGLRAYRELPDTQVLQLLSGFQDVRGPKKRFVVY